MDSGSKPYAQARKNIMFDPFSTVLSLPKPFPGSTYYPWSCVHQWRCKRASMEPLSVRTMGSVNGFNRSLRRRNGMEVGGGLVFIARGQPVGITINFVANTPVNGRRWFLKRVFNKSLGSNSWQLNCLRLGSLILKPIIFSFLQSMRCDDEWLFSCVSVPVYLNVP